MQELQHTLKQRYYRFVPGEYMPVRANGSWQNKPQFHMYKLTHPRETYYMLTHWSSDIVE